MLKTKHEPIYSSDCEAVYGIMKDIKLSNEQVVFYLNDIINRHEQLKQTQRIPLMPVVIINETNLNMSVIAANDFDNAFLVNEFVVNAHDLLKYYSH